MEKTNNDSPVNLPEKKFRAGAIGLSVWRNETEDKENSFRTITLDRSYKGKDGVWKRTNSFRVNDLPKAVVLLQKAYEYILLGDDERGV